MSPSVALEYGFPSTHSTNSISVALFFISVACEKLAPESPARIITTIACTFYAVSVVFGRVYCGMHTVTGNTYIRKHGNKELTYISITDCVGGTILAYLVYIAQWAFKDQFNALFTSESYWGKNSFPGMSMSFTLTLHLK